ncbi:ATP-dependent Clp protease adaptor ClpS [bacterium]|nr:ATP-dependent Clp protease adaptor ClpS [bacterium]
MARPFEELEPQTVIETSKKEQPRRPRRYVVLMLNDNYTPMDFVVMLLKRVFQKSEDESQRLMWQIHTEGRGRCGIFSYDIALSKIKQVKEMAEAAGHPLQCRLEPEAENDHGH